MKRPPLPVIGVVLLDLFAAGSSFFIVDQIGIIAASVEFLLFAGLAAGLWGLRKWAWLVEVILSVLQIAALLFGIAIALFASRMLEVPEAFPRGELFAFMTSLLFVNVLVVAVLATPKIRAEFH